MTFEYWKKYTDFTDAEKEYESLSNPRFLNLFKIVGYKYDNNDSVRSDSQQENLGKILLFLQGVDANNFQKFIEINNRFITVSEYENLEQYKRRNYKKFNNNYYFEYNVNGQIFFNILNSLFMVFENNKSSFLKDKFELLLRLDDKIICKEKLKNDNDIGDKKWNNILFGAPGTGKSNRIKDYAEIDENNKSKYFANYERVTFHPNYSYSQFVGTYKPVSIKDKNGDPKISYEYVPGPFIRVLKKALSDKDKKQKFLLIIEEINRANVAAVFGDMFQLLDRKNGESEYPINTPEDLKKYLKDELRVEYDTLTIPSNMYIWATMNSADQGVFPMDAAFKRRWNFEYLPIDNGEGNVSSYIVKGASEDYNWNNLRKAINKTLKSKVDWINEDKLLGPWFVKPAEGTTISSDTFCNKVLMYLYEDVVKIQPDVLFKKAENSNALFYSDIKSNWEQNGIEAFVENVKAEYDEFDDANAGAEEDSNAQESGN